VFPVAVIVLAAGLSRRMGEPKLLLDLGGRPLLAHAVERACRSRCSPVVVVVSERLRAHADAWLPPGPNGADVRIIVNDDPAAGMSSSLRLGVEAVPPWARAAIVALGDQPLVPADAFDRLAEAYMETGAPIVMASYRGRTAHPVLFDRSLFPELLAVKGDRGGRDVIERHRDRVRTVTFDDPLAVADVDTPRDLEALREALARQ